MHYTSWRDDESRLWKNSEHGWNIPLQYEENFEERIAQKCEKMAHTSKNRINTVLTKKYGTKTVNPIGNMTFRICTDTI